MAVLAVLLAAAGPEKRDPSAPPQSDHMAMAPYLDMSYCDAWERARTENETSIKNLRILMGENELTNQIAKLFTRGPCPRLSNQPQPQR